MTGQLPLLSKQYTNQPANTLAMVEIEVNVSTNKDRKIEKSVRFASETESLSDEKSATESYHSDNGSEDVMTWIPSEHLYSDDTFITESQTDCPVGGYVLSSQTEPSYGTNTFIDLDSEDETRTHSEYSYTDSFASSGVFSSHSLSDTGPVREWRDTTEIVKDIEDLVESVHRSESLLWRSDQEEESDILDSKDEEAVKQNFIQNMIGKLKRQASHRTSLHLDSQAGSVRPSSVLEHGSKEKAAFCQKMIEFCRRIKDKPFIDQPAESSDHGRGKDHQVLESYGLSSGVVERLKTENLQHLFNKKMADIDKETEKSAAFLRSNQHVEESFQREQFISHMKACVLRANIDESILAHCINMQPVKWASEFIQELPRFDDDFQEILYKYKKQLEGRIQKEKTKLTFLSQI